MTPKIINYSKRWTVGVGWEPLLDLCEKVLGEENWGYKEKYALLRIEVYREREEGEDDFVERIEELSAFICENCGALGEIRLDGWNKTMCDECYRVWKSSISDTVVQIDRDLNSQFKSDTDLNEMK